jgi:hypothetical protein
MNINCYYNFPHDEWNIPWYFDYIFNVLKNKYKNHKFKKINSTYLRQNSKGPCSIYEYHHMIIENDDNKKFFIITYWDKIGCIEEYSGWDMGKCVEIFASSGVHGNDIHYHPLEIKYTPFSYLTPRKDIDTKIKELSKTKNNQRIIPEKPSFKGLLYLFRKYLKNDDRFNVLSTDEGEYLQYSKYIEHLNKYAINMSLNGAGEICYRDMEIMGLGSALFRPKLVVKFNDPLIPNYHYISIDYDNIKNEYNHEKFYKLKSDLLFERWEEVSKNRDFIDYVAANGKKWFNKNVSKESHSQIIKKNLNLDKLL